MLDEDEKETEHHGLAEKDESERFVTYSSCKIEGSVEGMNRHWQKCHNCELRRNVRERQEENCSDDRDVIQDIEFAD